MTNQPYGEKWYLFSAYNSQLACGFGTEQEANTYCDILNRGRTVNVYGFEEMPAEDCVGLNAGSDTDGFRLDEAIVAQNEQDAAKNQYR
jgi:hypothetical protein